MCDADTTEARRCASNCTCKRPHELINYMGRLCIRYITYYTYGRQTPFYRIFVWLMIFIVKTAAVLLDLPCVSSCQLLDRSRYFGRAAGF